MSWPHSGKQKPDQPATKVRSFADLKNSHLVRSDHLGEESTQSRSLGGDKDSKQSIGKPPIPDQKKKSSIGKPPLPGRKIGSSLSSV